MHGAHWDPYPDMPKTSVPRAGDHSVPAIHLIKLPFELKPIVPNSVISGFKLHDQEFTDGPVLKCSTILAITSLPTWRRVI